jgi:hypothetical protein
MNLPLAGGHMPGIDVGLLEVGEDELTWGSIVAVGPEEHVGQPELGCDREEVLRLMVLGAIDDDDGVPPPLWPLLVQPGRQVPEEELHHLGVGVGLSEGDVHIPEGVQAEDHGDPRLHLELGDGVGRAGDLPLHPPEVGHPEPGLVDVDEDLLLSGLGQELDGPSLAQDQVLLRVRMERHRLDLAEAHAELLLHD